MASTVFVGQCWATLNNTPFVRYKHYTDEGGIATPLIAHWPNEIRGRGEFRRAIGHVVDIVPTILDAAGASDISRPPAAPPLAGRSLLPVFAKDERRGQRKASGPIFFHHEGNRALRLGDWTEQGGEKAVATNRRARS